MTAKRYQADNPMRVADDMIVGGVNGAMLRLPKGANSRLLGVDASGVFGYRALVSADITDGTVLNADIGAQTIRGGVDGATSRIAPGSLNGTDLATNSQLNVGSISSGTIVCSGRVTGNEASWGLYAQTGGVLSTGVIQCQVGGNALGIYAPSSQIRTDAGGDAFYAPNGNIRVGATVFGAALNVGGGGITAGALTVSGGGNSLYAPSGNCAIGGTFSGAALNIGGGTATVGAINASGQITASGALQSNRADGYALYAPSGGCAVAGNIAANGQISTQMSGASAIIASNGSIHAGGQVSCGGLAVFGQLHLNNTTTYGGGSSASASAFFYITINGSGWKVPLFA